MNKSLVMVDNFLPFPEEFRNYALYRDYSSKEWMGATYNGIGICETDLTKNVSEALGQPCEIELQFFRLTGEDHEATTYIHPDAACSEYAGVLYLSDPAPGCGTAFWTNKNFDMDRMPKHASEIEALGYTPIDFCEEIDKQGQSEDAWEMNSLAGMQFNRFIYYPSHLFHSRYPKKTWGTTKETSRLVWACFFRSI